VGGPYLASFQISITQGVAVVPIPHVRNYTNKSSATAELARDAGDVDFSVDDVRKT